MGFWVGFFLFSYITIMISSTIFFPLALITSKDKNYGDKKSATFSLVPEDRKIFSVLTLRILEH